MIQKNKSISGAVATFLALGISSDALAVQFETPYTHATRFNVAGQVTGTVAPDPDGPGPLRLLAVRNTYNSIGLLTKTEHGQLVSWADETVPPSSWGGYGFSGANIFSVKEYNYDAHGNLIGILTKGVDGTAESLVNFQYDTFGHVHCKAVRMNKAAFSSPPADACAVGPEGTQGPDRITRYATDFFGQVWKEERAVGTPLQQTYKDNTYLLRALTRHVDANGNRTDLRYDQHGRLIRRVYPSAGAPGSVNENDYQAYTYDSNGNMLTERKRNNTTITYTYDDTNRPWKKDLSDNSKSDDIEYDYDARGLTRYSRFVNSPAIGVFNDFDGFGRLRFATNVVKVGTTNASRVLEYRYDLNGNRTRVIHPDGVFFEYGFDGLNRAISVSESGSSTLLNVEYRADGKRGRVLRPSAATTNYAFNNANRLASINHDFAGTADDFTNTFSYNPAGQITQLTIQNSLYHFGGNSNKTGAYVPNGLNQYTQINGAPVTHDANGNLAFEGSSAYTHDMENRLVGTTSPSSALAYDPLGRLSEYILIPANGVQFLYDGDALVAEFTVSGNTATLTRRYVHGDQVDEPWVQYNGSTVGPALRRYLHADHQGSIVAHSDSGGAVQAKLSYDAFGIPRGPNIDRFQYTGQAYLRELSLFHYKARMYSPRLGRFLQTDPIFYEDDMNMYAYAAGDPMNRVDPTGLQSTSCVGIPQEQVEVCLLAESAIRATEKELLAGVTESLAEQMNELTQALDQQFGASVIDEKGNVHKAGRNGPMDEDPRYRELGSEPLKVNATQQERRDRANHADRQRKLWEQEKIKQSLVEKNLEKAEQANVEVCKWIDQYYDALETPIPSGSACSK